MNFSINFGRNLEGENILETFEKQRKKDLSVCEKVKDDVYVSRFEGLNLQQYINARNLFCKKKHAQTCIECSLLISVAQHILEHGFKGKKNKLKTAHPGMYEKFERVWTLREKNLVDVALPHKCILPCMLLLA